MGVLRVLVGGQWVDIGVGITSPSDADFNLLDNAGFQIGQQGFGPYAGQTGAGLLFDRWQTFINSCGTWTHQVFDLGSAAPQSVGGSRYLQTNCTVAKAQAAMTTTEEVSISQSMEGQRLQQLGYGTPYAKSMSLSFWFYTTVAGTYWINALNSGGALRQFATPYTVTTPNTWIPYTVAIPGDTVQSLPNTNARALQLVWFLAAGNGMQSGSNTGAWVANSGNNNSRAPGQVNLTATVGNFAALTNAILNVGAPLPFVLRPYTNEYTICRRYFQRWQDPPLRGVFNTTTQAARAGMALPVPMRATPALSLFGSLWAYDGANSVVMGAGSITNNYSREERIEADFNGTGGPAVVGRAAVFFNSPGGLLDANATI